MGQLVAGVLWHVNGRDGHIITSLTLSVWSFFLPDPSLSQKYTGPQKPLSGVKSGASGAAPPCDVVIPSDQDDRAVLETLLGEASTPGEGTWGPDEFGPEAYNKPSGTLLSETVRDEMLQMIAVLNNRLTDSNWKKQYGYGGLKDVASQPGQFLGYGPGQNILKAPGSNGDTNCERARLAVSAIKDFHEAPFKTPFFYWKGIKQKGKISKKWIIVRRDGAFRLANTDFMINERE